MENFIVSARKYRPATFDMVVGQETITNTLRNAISNKHLAQAYLFCGPRGVGKTTCARIFAKTINCTNLKENAEACDKCESCLSFNSLRSFNIHELDAASNNKVEDIRSLNDQVRIPPQIGKYSIYIIDEVHMLSSSAFNAFLKTLEEPPSHAIFILATTEKHKIIPTILSRCQIFDFSRIKVEDIVSRLRYVAKNESVSTEEEALHVIALKADGAMRDGLSIFDQLVSLCGKNITYRDTIENLNVLDYEYYFKCTDAALTGDVSSALLTFNEILEKGFDGLNFITGLNSHFRDLLVSRDQSTLRLLETTPLIRQRYQQQAASCSIDFLYKALELGSACDVSYRNSKNPRLHVELTLIRICNLLSDKNGAEEKKKPDLTEGAPPEKEFQVPSRSSIIRESEDKATKRTAESAELGSSHFPRIEKEVKSVSIRNLISDSDTTSKPSTKPGSASTEEMRVNESLVKPELNSETLPQAWKDFIESMKDEGPRIISMLKSIEPDFENGSTIIIPLSNAAQKDLFVLNYKPRLIGFLEKEFRTRNIDIETRVDLTDVNELPYSDEQKFNYLQAKYPSLKDLKKTFNLDLT
jgi:DNA polymerase-3 subunit gamma/tau